MRLPIFKSWKEKEQYYNLCFANNFSEFKDLIQNYEPEIRKKIFCGVEFSAEIRYLFRGVNNSSFRMFSSLHRCLDDRKEKYGQELTLSSLKDEIYRRFKEDNNGFLYKEYKRQMPEGTISSQPSIWAFIQHFGGPSPLLDFTSDLESSLFFAFDKMKPVVPNNPMSEYVSLYVLQDNPMRVGEVTNQYADGAEYATEAVIDHENTFGETVDTDAFVVECVEQPLNNIAWGSMVYGGEKGRHSFRIPDAHNSQIVSAVDNINISAQMGNFFQGNISEVLPLEQAPSIIKYGTSIEIRKSIIEEIKANYNLPTESEVYPEKMSRLMPLYDAMTSLWIPKKIEG